MDHSETAYSMDNVHKYLQMLSKNDNIMEELKRILSCWDYKSTASINDFEEDIEQVVGEIRDFIFPNINDGKIDNFVWNFVHFEIYDHISSLIKEKFSKDDLNIYRLSKEFCKNNGSPKQLGATFYNFIPNAAVVELSMLNNKRTPMEKLDCLRSAYDYIFAEVKGALNFHHIKILRKIYQVFEESVNKIWTKSEGPEKPEDKLNDRLSVCDTIRFIETVAAQKTSNQTVLEEEKKRVVKLITSATTEDLI